MKLAIVALIVLALNLPFGYWRAATRKFSLAWVLAIHIPVPLVIGLRFASHLGFQLATYPVMVGAFFWDSGPAAGFGQDPGGRCRTRRPWGSHQRASRGPSCSGPLL